MKKKVFLTVVLLVLGLGAMLGFRCYQQYQARFVWIGGVRYEKDIKILELPEGLPEDPEILLSFPALETLNLQGSGISAQEYDRVKQMLPAVQVLWEIPFQGDYCNMFAERLTITELSEADMELLPYFTRLRQIDAYACEDYAILSGLRARYPQVAVNYQIRIGEQSFDYSTEEITLCDADASRLEQVLPFFDDLKKVSFEGQLPEAEALCGLREAYPEVEFYWQVTVLGQIADISTTELDFSGMKLESAEEIVAAVPYLPNLEKVLMMECGLSNEQMAQLNADHQDVLFVWNVHLGQGMVLRSDATVFAPVLEWRKVYDRDLKNLRYCTELVLIDLGHMQISDVSFLEYMPEVRFLILADTNVSDLTPLSGLKKLQFLELFISPIRDYSPLLGCTALEQLNISGTYADIEPLKQMTWLKRLWHVMWHLTPEERIALAEALPNTLVRNPTSGSTGGGWRDCDLYYEMRDMMGLPYNVD